MIESDYLVIEQPTSRATGGLHLPESRHVYAPPTVTALDGVRLTADGRVWVDEHLLRALYSWPADSTR